MVVTIGILLLIGCTGAMAGMEELPPLRNLKAMGEEELMAFVAEQPGMEFLKEVDNNTMVSSVASTRIDPDVLEDSVLLTVRF